MVKKVIRIASALIFTALFIGTLVFLFNKSKTEPEVYTTAFPEIRTIINKTVATGSVLPRNETEVIPQVSGIIEKVYVEAGEMVRKGQKIAKIRIIPNMLQLNNAESRVKRARLNVNDKKKNFERYKTLFDQKAISVAEYQQAELSFKDAQAELAAVEDALMIVKEGVSKESGKATNTIVTATIPGMVLDVPVEEGYSVIEANTFNPGTIIATIADMTDMIFKGQVDETEVGKIKAGMPLMLKIGALDNVIFDADLSYIAPKGHKQNGATVFEIKANIKLIDSIFVRAGYSANADIVLQRADSVVSIAEKNLIFENGKTFVEVVQDTLVFEKKEIALGISDGIYSQVQSGISVNDKIKVQN